MTVVNFDGVLMKSVSKMGLELDNVSMEFEKLIALYVIELDMNLDSTSVCGDTTVTGYLTIANCTINWPNTMSNSSHSVLQNLDYAYRPYINFIGSGPISITSNTFSSSGYTGGIHSSTFINIERNPN